jgi:TonB family protein
MVGFSVVLHAVTVAALVFAPAPWRTGTGPETPKTVMTISLGGAPGPRSGGMTPMGGRPVQTTEPAPKPEAVRPPAAKPPEMTMPNPRERVVPKSDVKRPPDQARGRTPTRGEQVQEGSAVAETGARGMGFGLTTGGGGTGGYLDIANFCCPDYITTMLQLIQQNWNSKQGVAGETMIKFTILRDGRISDVEMERSSGYAALDLTSQRALLMLRRLPPLPPEFTEDHLTVHLRFQYQR